MVTADDQSGLDRRIADAPGPRRQVLADGTEIEWWEGAHEATERRSRLAASVERSAPCEPLDHQSEASTDAPADPGTSCDQDWLDDFVEGSTNEEVMDRVKRGMLIFRGDTDPDVIARETIERFHPDD